MPEKEKIRAGRNRTLTINPDEIECLKKEITTIDELKRFVSADRNVVCDRNRMGTGENPNCEGRPAQNILEDGVAKNLLSRGDHPNSDDFLNRTVNGDLLEVLPLLPDGFADLAIIDPPYNLTKNFNGFAFNEMQEDEYEAYLDSWLPGVCQKLKPNGSLYICGDWKSTSALQRALQKNLVVMNRITWQREKGRGAKSNWKNGMEDIWFAVKNPRDYYFDVEAVKIKRKVIAPYKVCGKPKDWDEGDDGNFRITYPSNFWDDISIPFWSMPENTDHPTQKPEKLYAKLILASCPVGGVVFDPFLGSGTASVVAKKLGRKYLGVELNEEYCLWTAKRLRQAETDKEIQGFKNGVFWERNSLNEQAKENRRK